jgi:flagellar biosynthesis/type III secretory pathway protein FliH
MIFEIYLKGESCDAPVFADAPSAYDAVQWARARYGERYLDVKLRDDSAPEAAGVGVIIVERTTQTSYERDRAHAETIIRQAYDAGYAAGDAAGYERGLQIGRAEGARVTATKAARRTR